MSVVVATDAGDDAVAATRTAGAGTDGPVVAGRLPGVTGHAVARPTPVAVGVSAVRAPAVGGPGTAAAAVWEIRPLRWGDDALVRFLVGRLTPESRYRRFRSPAALPSAEVLRRLARPDGWHHIALVAFAPVVREPIALGEVFRMDAFEDGEAALLVADGWQSRGVGTALLAGLVDAARDAGFRRLSGDFLAEHRAARRLLVRSTAGQRFVRHGGTTAFRASI